MLEATRGCLYYPGRKDFLLSALKQLTVAIYTSNRWRHYLDVWFKVEAG